MLSVLIPSYNRSIIALVNQLQEQLQKEKILYEIICLDDGSKGDLNKENKKINTLTNCSFNILKKNIGRSKIRNLLGSKAKYDWLLFLDDDVLLSSDDFISKYLKQISLSKSFVVLGGIKYSYADDKHLLRWKFGKNSEEVDVSVRNKKPYNFFFTANFLIKKSIFNSIKFNNQILNYGYEDLLFSKALLKKNIAIEHIQNEVFHRGIDKNKEFIAKIKKGINNLHYLLIEKKLSKEDTKLSNIYFKLKGYRCIFLLMFFSRFFEKKAIDNGSVFYFNLFRITYLHKVFKNME